MLRSVTLIAALALTTTAQAQHVGDILLTVREGRIVTGSLNAQNLPEYGQRVFLARLGEAAPNFTADPGFDSVVGTFPAGSRNGFNILDALREWNGTDFSIISQSQLEVSFATLTARTPLEENTVPGFTLSVGSNGQWHRHLDYVLESPATPGFYLYTFEIFSNNAAIAPSEPLYIVFNQDMPRGMEQAVRDFVQQNYVDGEAPCAADFNQDGGVDGGDVESFFTAWAIAEPTADVNQDGGIDGADVESFFVVWTAGGC
jgi:hypothetical protein